jgi:hypothetical protein
MAEKFYGEDDILVAFRDSEVTIKKGSSEYPCLFSQREVDSQNYGGAGGHLEQQTAVTMRTKDYEAGTFAHGDPVTVAETDFTILRAQKIMEGAVTLVFLREA